MLTALMILASYRITRFFIYDSLIEAQRTWFLKKLWGETPSFTRAKIHELLTCSKCLSVWVSLGVVFTVNAWVTVPLPWLQWLAVSGGGLVIWRWVED